MPITISCEVCNKTFTVKPYRAKTARFCSRQCGGKWHMANREMPRAHLSGNQHRKGKRPTNAFTSEQVSGKANAKWVAGERFECEFCNKSFFVKPWIIRQNGSPRFCSRECFRESGTFLGEKSPNWVGGPQTYRGRSWQKARSLVVKRDNGACQRCGRVVGDSISVHHIRPFREFASEAEANAMDNLICLCQSCHMKVEPRQPCQSSA